MSADSGLTFWLDYVESRGGLWESAGDSTIVMIPPQLQRRLELPEEFAVTEHPDVAREDHVTLLGAGHPLLTAAAEDVLSADDAGVLVLTTPAGRPPDDHRLLAKARDQFPVEHGRIDASGPAERALRQVLRVGALVTYTASADEVFHERAECWVDVPTRRELPGPAAAEMRRYAGGGHVPAGPPDLAAVPAAVARAHRLLEEKFSERCQALAAGSARVAAAEELARTTKYYAEALASLARRQATAAADRQALLAARADAVRAEEQRRLAEIEEKYAARHDIRPFRLHLLLVPVLRLPVDVLRGARRFPLVLDWMLPAGAFAPLNCPGCGADTARWPLAAAKTGLGCASCLAAPAGEPDAPAATAPAAPASAGAAPPAPAGRAHAARTTAGPPETPPAAGVTGGPGSGRSEASSRAPAGQARGAGTTAGAGKGRADGGGQRPGRPAAPPRRPAAARPVPPAAKKKRPGAQAVSAAGDKLAMEFWSVTAQANARALRRLCTPDTPAAAVIRLFGADGPLVAVGLAADEGPQSLTSVSEVFGDGELAGTGGYLSTSRADYTYLLRWHPQTRLVSEVLPFGAWVSDRLPAAVWMYGPGAQRMFRGLPEPDAELDPVAARLWRKGLPVHGLPVTVRCLTAWWRIGDGPGLLDRYRPSVLAAAVHRMVGHRAGQAGTTHDAIADWYKVASADTRAVTPLLQSRLRLTQAQPW